MEVIKEPKIELYNIDCMEYMKTCKDKEFDLAIVDPPYGIKAVQRVYKGRENYLNKNDKYPVKKGNHRIKTWDNERPTKQYFDELFRVSKNQLIWGANYFADLIPVSRGWIFWDKNVYGDFSDGELAWTSFDKAMKKVLFVWDGMRQGVNIGNLSPHGGNRSKGTFTGEDRIHPTQKPRKLYEWILQNYAELGQRILDTHLGSGSSAIAAYNYKFDFVGCEIDKEYFEAAKKRFETHKSQLQLW